MEKKTPLYAKHEEYQGKIVPFGGFLLPIQYSKGIIYEHKAVREKVGLFDVSHMGEFILEGNDALANLNYLLSNDFTDLASGMVRYGILCYENGGVVDDLLVYKLKDNRYLLVVNASNTEKDYEWIKGHLSGEVNFQDISERVAQVALQGPLSEQVLKKLTNELPETYYSFIVSDIEGMECLISRTGYTGEDGFEIYASCEVITKIWERLMEEGKDEQIEPAGLGCRDTLRLEAGMPLYGHEMSREITPLMAGLKMFVKLDKEFIGKEALLPPPLQRRMGLQLIDKGIAREGCKVYLNDQEVGIITSGTMSPTLNKAVAMALVNVNAIADQNEYLVEVRGRFLKAERIKMPFYKRNKGEKTQ